MTPAAACVLGLLLVLVWNVALGGRIAQRSTAPSSFRLLTGLCGFLVAPALLVGVGGEGALTARALVGLAWLWPLVQLLFAVQAAYAYHRRLASRFIVLPIAAFNTVIAFAGVCRYAVSLGFDLGALSLTPGMAVAQLVAQIAGTSTIASPLAVLVPILAPAGEAETSAGTAARTALACVASAVILLLGAAAVPAYRALRASDALGTERATEVITTRERGSLMTGLRILPALTSAPPAAALREDFALAELLGVDVLLVRLKPEGCTIPALDSLDRALEPFRRDSTRLIIALELSRDMGHVARTSDTASFARRGADIDRLVRHLNPDYLLAAGDSYDAADAAPESPPLEWWQRMLAATSLAAHRARPATRVILATRAGSARDSILFDWASAPGSPVDATAFTIAPNAGGAVHVAASLAAAERWMLRAGDEREHWIIASAAPALEGEEAQRRLMRHVLVWASARPRVRGVVLADAADYDRITGFRTPGGRLRRAAADAASTIRTLADAPTPSP